MDETEECDMEVSEVQARKMEVATALPSDTSSAVSCASRLRPSAVELPRDFPQSRERGGPSKLCSCRWSAAPLLDAKRMKVASMLMIGGREAWHGRPIVRTWRWLREECETLDRRVWLRDDLHGVRQRVALRLGAREANVETEWSGNAVEQRGC